MKRFAPLLVVLLVAAILASPYLLWRAAPQRQLEVAILDNTVPDSSFREHRGLTWVLNHEKYRSARHGTYDAARDYYGFFPLAADSFRVTELPDSLRADLIYLADTYGVYEKEWYEENPRGERSPEVYGGMRGGELDKVERAVRAGTPLVVEFNSFASPTDRATRVRLYDLLQVEWTGWIGRYFNDLTEGGEVPAWAVRAYERQYQREWKFTGEGFLLADEHDTVVVLRPGTDFSSGQCEIIFDEAFRTRFGAESGIRYRYWFDIIRLRERGREAAHFRLDLTRSSGDRLAELGIPATFPAVVHHDAGDFQAWYFAGDFVDTETVPRLHRFYGYPRLKTWFMPDRPAYENQAFFWRVYVPMMRTILAEAYGRTGRNRS